MIDATLARSLEITLQRAGLYIHIPFCKQKCTYCDFAAYENIEPYMEPYVEALIKEILLHKNRLGSVGLDTIYFGGGTPTHLPLVHLEKIMMAIEEAFSIDTCREIAIESNPGECDLPRLRQLRQMGFTRISYGVQTMDDSILKLLRRSHTAADVLKSLDLTRQAEFNHINCDFIYALPKQSERDLQETLRLLEEAPVDHTSIYGLQLEPGTYLYSQVKKKQVELPTEEEAEAMYDYMVSYVESLGFERYEISNFAKNKAYSLHNLKYWLYAPYIGIGAGAHGFYKAKRYGNSPYVVPYINALQKGRLPTVEEHDVDDEEGREDFSYLHLRTKWGIPISSYEKIFHRNFLDDYGHVVRALSQRQLVIKEGDRLRLTSLGMKYGNYVFSQFIN